MNEFQRLQRDARARDREWVEFVQFERALYVAYESVGLTLIDVRNLVKWVMKHE